MKRTQVLYHGDINIEYGGYFYELDRARRGWGYANVLRITPCSEAGLADNEFWIERLSVTFPDHGTPRERDVLSAIGREDDAPEYETDEYWATLIDACVAYGQYDTEQSDVVRIGKRDTLARECMRDSDVTIKLRGNASLERFAKAQARDYFN
ncbi:hypothetical protein BcepSauron_045 [Burkholderia phage BcepSauron]|uniref:Uncharacterized protein n=1 Tax=Burkholderia phage BcepSauron TaxID=2530033 RepID=A0A482MLD3_9CAUD|nr:hypothetical protein H1O17_gp045 [Burkholderia phage BcepSauron]QBQ74425.1 hypothetical protein BcepSauron_045 [Burkholderia phage BcepSauron]